MIMTKQFVLFSRCFAAAILCLMFAMQAQAQTPYTFQQNTTFTSATSGPAIYNVGSGTAYHYVVISKTGTVSACSFTVDSSPDNVTWTAGGVITSTSCTANGNTAATAGVANWTRVTVSSFTGTGSVQLTYLGYATNPGGGGGGGVSSVSGTAPISVATGTTTPVISMAQANSTTNGYLGSTDWTTFNGKQAALGYTPADIGNCTAGQYETGDTASGPTCASVSAANLTGTLPHAQLPALVSGDIPNNAANTTGTAANVTGTVAIANGGTGQTTQQAAINALTGSQTSGTYLRSNGTNTSLSALQLSDSAALNSASGGFMISDGRLGNASTLQTTLVTTPYTVSVANTVYYCQFVQPYTMTIGHAGIRTATTASSGNAFNVGIYSVSGSKLIDSGALSTISATTNVTTAVATGAGTTLTMNTSYLFVWAATSVTPNVYGFNANGTINIGYITMLNSMLSTLPNGCGTAANALSAGALPVTLGTLTATSTGTTGMPVVIWAY